MGSRKEMWMIEQNKGVWDIMANGRAHESGKVCG